MSDVKELKNSASPSVMNSLTSFTESVLAPGSPFQTQQNQISQTDSLYFNNRWYLISNNRQLLGETYVEHGIVQTLVDQPVDDAFRAGYEIKSKHLDADDIERLEYFVEKHRVNHAIMQGAKWARLFGGGGVMVIVEQNPSAPLDIASLKEGSRIQFRSFDLWEMYNTQGTDQQVPEIALPQEYYDYYGYKIHNTRVFRMSGKEAPSTVRPRLRGWGMSELERLIRSLNQYIKNQDVVYELLDEAKVDVYKIKGLNDAMLTEGGTAQVTQRVQMSNMVKNYLNAITMDAGDEYEQKQMTFTGLGDMLTQIRQGIAADLKMPMTKLFGISAAGFSSGEDDIENYNSMVEGEVRSKVKFIVVDMLQICCQILFGFVPDDLNIKFKPLRILNAEQEEQVKNSQFNRTMSAYQSGAIDALKFKEAMNKGSLLPVELEENDEAGEPLQGQFTVSSEKKVDG